MGLNTITCKGVYEETGKTGFGEAVRTSGDFDGSDLLKCAALTALMALGTFAAGCVGKDESPNFEQHQYRLNRFGDTTTIHDEATNKTYELDFDGLMERRAYVSSYKWPISTFMTLAPGGKPELATSNWQVTVRGRMT